LKTTIGSSDGSNILIVFRFSPLYKTERMAMFITDKINYTLAGFYFNRLGCKANATIIILPVLSWFMRRIPYPLQDGWGAEPTTNFKMVIA